MPAPTLLFILLSASTTLLGATLLLLALRRPPLNPHPTCRKCHYDLTGKSPTSPRCPECGSDLTSPNSITLGHRPRNPAKILTGLSILLVSASALVLRAHNDLRNVNWLPYLPYRYVLSRTQSNNPAVVSAAMTELIRRYDANSLKPAQVNRLIARAFALRANPAATWSASWGDLIERAYPRGQVSLAQWDTYWRAIGLCILTPRPIVRRGDPLVLQLYGYITDRLQGTDGEYDFKWNALTLDVDGIPCDASGIAGRQSDTRRATQGFINWPKQILLTPEALKKLNDGPHVIHATLQLQAAGYPSRAAPPVSYSFTSQISAQFTLIPADAISVQLAVNPALRDAIQSSIAVDENQVVIGTNHHARLRLRVSNPPGDLAFIVLLRQENRQWNIDDGLTCVKNGGNNRGFDGIFPDLDAPTVDIVLHPSANVATTTMMTQIWGEDIIIPNVPIIHQSN